MRINLYLKLLVAFFVAMPCFADGVKIIGDEYGNRLVKFNDDPLNGSAYMPHTTKINGILKEERNVTSRAATVDEKETILKAVMASVVVHGFDAHAASVFDKRSTLTADTALSKHFEILRLTEMLAWDYMQQVRAGVWDRSFKEDYSNLYDFSGLKSCAFDEWFYDVFNEHCPGVMETLGQKQGGRAAPSFAPDINGLRGQFIYPEFAPNAGYVIFGDVQTHALAGHKAVFVSTYHLNQSAFLARSIVVKLPGSERYIVIQTPNYDNDAYSIRAHPIVHPDANASTNINSNLPIQITSGDNGSVTVGIDDSGASSIHTHDGTFSPNNKKLTGVAARSLADKETFSFVSHVAGVDTFHLLIGDINRMVAFVEAFLSDEAQLKMGDPLIGREVKDLKASTFTSNGEFDSLVYKYKSTGLTQAIKSQFPNKNFGDFLKLLQHPLIVDAYSNLDSHLAKMTAFIEGRI